LIRLGVVGANGKMGSEVVNLALNNNDFELFCAVDKFGAGKKIAENVIVEVDLKEALVKRKPDIVVDFTQPSVIYDNIKIYMEQKVTEEQFDSYVGGDYEELYAECTANEIRKQLGISDIVKWNIKIETCKK